MALFVIVERYRGTLAGTSTVPQCSGELYDSADEAQAVIDELIQADDDESEVAEYSIHHLVEVRAGSEEKGEGK